MKVYPVSEKILPEEIVDAREKFIKTGVLKKGVVRPIIAESWKECYRMGINPYRVSDSVFTVKDRQEKEIEDNAKLIKLAEPFMKNLYQVLEKTRNVVVLYSRNGYTIHYAGKAEDFDEQLKHICCWAEEYVGTSGFSLVSKLKVPLQIIGPEYYCKVFSGISGSHAPIHNEKGDFLGSIAIASWNLNPHAHTLGMVIAASKAIENDLKQHAVLEELNFYIKELDATIDSMSDGLITTNLKGEILEINRAAEEILALKRDDIKFKNIDRQIQAKPDFLALIDKTLKSGNILSDDEINITSKGRTKRFIASIKLIEGENKEAVGVVILLKNIKRIKKIAEKIISSQARYTLKDILGESSRIKDARYQIVMAARTPSNVLIEGESGTGKELFAHSIHNLSHRSDGPFISLNCSAIPQELFESILFGYEKGAFTGAKKEGHPGKFELADGGTLFLDEIGELPLTMQVKLLRVLSEGWVERLGGKNPIIMNVRIIAATNKVIMDEVKKGKFRTDLYYRLNVLNLNIPPLRERKEDIPILVNHFIKKVGYHMGKEIESVSSEFIQVLKDYSWPGNVRELQNVIERALNVARRPMLDIDCVPDYLKNPKESFIGNFEALLPLSTMEKNLIKHVLIKCQGNKSKAANILGIGRDTLYRKLREYSPGLS
ncbi:MAG: sigma 54-interacting transcriptional regulator [Thermodesulfobacteriota bacterium]|nr:sigma 54-interacting transcriptional regulator [Thermodesulfobacteriota bacterium]